MSLSNQIKPLCLAIAATAMAGVAQAQDVKISTDGGLSVKSADGQFAFATQARVHWDLDSSDGIYNGGADHLETEMRRGRFGFYGKAYGDWAYDFFYDVGEQAWDTALIQYRGFTTDSHKARLNMGIFKRPALLEVLTSSNWSSTIEKSVLADVTKNDISDFGMGWYGSTDLFSYQAGLFNDKNTDEEGSEILGYAGRFVVHPFAEKGNALHLAASYNNQNLDGQTDVSIKSRLGVHTADKNVFGEIEMATDDSQFGLEAAWVTGPFSLQAEYIQREIENNTDTLEVSAYYLQATYTLTGESRGYKAHRGRMDKIKPSSQSGAWELVARLEHLESDQDSVNATSEGDVFVVGANWYINKRVRAMFNYVTADSSNLVEKGQDEDGSSIGARIQFQF